MFIKILFVLFGIIIFLFLFWRRLKDDYTANQIFSSAFYILFGLVVLFLFSSYFYPTWWFWTSLVGSVLGATIGILRFRLRFFETLEAFVLGFLPIIGLLFLYDWLFKFHVISVFGVITVFFLIMIFQFLDARYRTFTWYKSGRIGFTGITIIGLLFLTRCVVAVFFDNVVSFVGNLDAVISGTIAFLAFLGVFTLARLES